MTRDIRRADELEALLGVPEDPGNPVGFEAILAADERGETLAEGERLLDEFGLNAEFVPPEHGGRLHRLDDLAEIMRSVYRRDPALGLGHGASSLLAAVNVWTAGSTAQRDRTAELLLTGRRVACAYHELAHGNDLAAAEFSARPVDGGLVLSGRKELVANISRAEAWVLFARTGTGAGSRNHSQVLVERADLPSAALVDLPRLGTSGMRGVHLGGLEIADCPVPAEAVLGTVGHGVENALKAFQLSRIGLPAMMTGALDSALRLAVRQVHRRRLYGRAAAELPYLRSVLAGVFADLLVCEVFAGVVARAVHLVPAEVSCYAAAVKYQVARLLLNAMDRLAEVLGAKGYLREGESAVFQKLLRDVRPIGFGHAARAVCQVAVIPQLPLFARRGWRTGSDVPEDLFRPDAELPRLDCSRLSVSAGGRDPLAAALVADVAAVSPPGAGGELGRLRALGERFAGELESIKVAAAELDLRGRPVPAAGTAAYDLAARYFHVLTAAACLGTWRRSTGWLGQPAWAVAALSRLTGGPGRRAEPVPAHVEEQLFAELVARFGEGRAFGASGRALRVSESVPEQTEGVAR